MPIEADCPRLTTSTCPSMTKPMYAAYRMEPQIALADQMMCSLLAKAIVDDVTVQAAVTASYSTVRTAILANPDSVAALLTTTT